MWHAAIQHFCSAVERVGGSEVNFGLKGMMKNFIAQSIHVTMNRVLRPTVRNNIARGKDATGGADGHNVPGSSLDHPW